MSLADEYRRQHAWRAWDSAYAVLPPLDGRTVLDLGCGVGDPAADLAARGARVVGIDQNPELLRAARSRDVAGNLFVHADLRALPVRAASVDGLWCSFAPAYFTHLPAVLARWAGHVRSGGWIALTEIDDLFGHEPLGAEAREAFDDYAREALATGRYDFRMGRRLRENVEACGLAVARELSLDDREFAFMGPASSEVIEAWRARFERMAILRERCGARFAAVRDEFLACLARPDHRSTGGVRFCLACKA